MSALLDTHAALWYVAGDSRLGGAARELIDGCSADERYVSDLMLYEVGLMVSRNRVAVDGPIEAFLRELAGQFRVVPIDHVIAALAVQLTLPQSDPFDRIFVATALRHKLPLVTRDRAIRDSKIVATVW